MATLAELPSRFSPSLLNGFTFERTLSKSASELKLLGELNGNAAIVMVKMPSFGTDEENVKALLSTSSLERPTLENNEYSVYRMFGDAACSSYFPYEVQIICPADDFHINKHSNNDIAFVRETKEIYEEVTKVHLQETEPQIEKQLSWLYAILNGEKEQESIFFDNPDEKEGFVLLPNEFNWPDAKVKNPSVSGLSCLAIVRPRGLKTIRDLTAEHLPLLRNIREEGTAAIATTYGVEPEFLRVYFHYLPTFYHLHVHFTHIDFTKSALVDRAILLDDVIEMLEEDDFACQTKSFTYSLPVEDPLYKAYGVYRRLPSPLRSMSKRIVNATDSLKLERARQLKKHISKDRVEALKGVGHRAQDSMALPRMQDMKKAHDFPVGVGHKATDSMSLPRTEDLKRLGEHEFWGTAEDALSSPPPTGGIGHRAQDSMHLPRTEDLKRLRENEYWGTAEDALSSPPPTGGIGHRAQDSIKLIRVKRSDQRNDDHGM
jgi:m7GpppX diphosphatase